MFKTFSCVNILKKLFNYRLIQYKLGEFNYSDYGYIVLGAIIENVSHKSSYLDVFNDLIFKKLKMKNTSVGDTNITLYNYGGTKINNKQYLERYVTATSGSLYSTMKDFMIFSMNINKLLNKQTIKLFEKLYFYSKDAYDDTHTLHHTGEIFGGLSKWWVKYNKDWKFQKILLIKFQTGGTSPMEYYI